MNKLLTKKNILNTSGILSIILLILNQIGTDNLCGGLQNRDCMTEVYNILILFFFPIPLFLLSLITYRMRDEIFERFRSFAMWWIPLMIFLVLLAPQSDSSLIPIDKGRVSFVMSLLFFLISLFLIAWRWFALRGKK